MKKGIFSLLALLMVAAAGCIFQACDSGNKQKLKVLYVGGSSNIETAGGAEVDSAALAASAVERMANFTEFLNEHFTDVTVVNAKDYNADMSKEYDVTLFDGTPEKIRDKVIEYDESGRTTKYIPAAYLPEDFTSPAVFIASASETLGRTIGSKNDWYCLCLDNYALGMNKEHQIFKGPFKVEMETEMLPTPAGIMETAPMQGFEAPAEIEMWKVSEGSYGDEANKGIRIGMVSRPGGYLDSPETEVISGGKSAKTIDAIAIGRHGNLFHWGFAADPKKLTPSAREALANAIVYAARFKDQPIIARKKNDRIFTRDHLNMLKWGYTQDAWNANYENELRFYNMMDSIQKVIAVKNEKGEALDSMEKIYAQYPPAQKPEKGTFEDYLKKRQPDMYAQFGADTKKYDEYYDTNFGYFMSNPSGYGLVIDEDVKAMGIANNDVKVLEMAVADLEGENADRAKRVLERYTLCRFNTPAEWKAWLEKYKDKLFFTEGGGYLWLVNSYDPDVVGNNYSVLEK